MIRDDPAGHRLRAQNRIVLAAALAFSFAPVARLGAARAERDPAGPSPLGSAWAVSPDGFSGDRVYDDLEHLRARGLWSGSLGALPLTRGDCLSALRSIREAGAGRDLGTADLVRVRRLERVAAAWGVPEPPRSVSGEPGGDDARERLARLEAGAELRAWFVASDLDSLADTDRCRRREQLVSVTADAALGTHLYAQLRVTEDYARQTPYRRGRGWADNFPSGFRRAFTDATARNERAILGCGWGWGDIRLGREDRHWGAGRPGTLFLSGHPFPLDGVSLRARTRRFSAASLFAQLRRGGRNLPVDSVAAADPRAAVDAWMAAHRFEARPWPALRVGLSEAVAYGGRGVDLGYLNPVGLLAATAQGLDDRSRVDDKKVLGFDLSVDLPPATLYGEFLINRVVSLDAATRGDSTQISSYAQLVGALWTDPAGWSGAGLRLTYAHLDPEVYFHHDGDPGRALLHEGEVVGHWLGPNADDFRLSLRPPPRARWGDFELAYEQTRWGVIDGKRGTELGFAGLVRRQKGWITGRKEIERIFSVEWSDAEAAAPFDTRLDAGVRVARVERSGRRRAEGWQAEARLTWRGSISGWEAAER